MYTVPGVAVPAAEKLARLAAPRRIGSVPGGAPPESIGGRPGMAPKSTPVNWSDKRSIAPCCQSTPLLMSLASTPFLLPSTYSANA